MRMSVFIFALLGAATIGAAGYGIVTSLAASDHGGHSVHKTVTSVNQRQIPTEAGQSAFAAIAEIVQILDSNPNTDWAQVKIDTLREHLVDMELLTTQVVVSQVNEGDKTIFLIGGNPAAVEAAKRMVPAHSEELKNNQGWNIESSVTDENIRMTVSPTKYIPTDKIRGLGFFGIMSIGAHHQPHHLGMAAGTMIH